MDTPRSGRRQHRKKCAQFVPLTTTAFMFVLPATSLVAIATYYFVAFRYLGFEELLPSALRSCDGQSNLIGDVGNSNLPVKILSPHNASCRICRLPKFCVSRDGMVLMAPSARERILNLAKSKECNLVFDEKKSVVRFSVRDSSIIDFRGFVEDAIVRPMDVLNIENSYAFGNTPISKTYVHHIPHYYRTVFLSSWRIASILADLTEKCKICSKSGKQAYCSDYLTPTFLTLDTARASNKQWFEGAHALFRKAYPSTIVLDLADGGQRVRYQAPECYRSGFVSACEDPWWAAFHSEAQRKLSRAVSRTNVRSALTVGFLSRKRSRSLLNVEQTKEYILKGAKVFKIPVNFVSILFESQTFEYQANSVAEVDILIAAHGAGLTNVMFMSSNSLLIEVIPFGYNQDFEDLARIAGIHYRKVFAFPLTHTVVSCARKHNLTKSEEKWLKNFEKAAARVKVPTGDSNPVPYLDFGSTASIPTMINCLRDQNLTLQPDTVGGLASRHLARLNDVLVNL